MNRLIIIDGNAILHRAFHALPPLTAPDGTLTNAKTPDGIDDSLQIRVYSVSQGEL